MKRSIAGAAFFALFGSRSLALADPPREAPPAYDDGAPRNAPPEYVAEPLPTPPPLGHRGFQLAIRSGIMLPMGSAKDADSDDASVPGAGSQLKNLVGPQLPIQVDIGGKPDKHVFVGGYLEVGLGLAAGDLSDGCEAAHRDCNALSFRFGAQVNYAIAPDDRLNPWVGYGLGFSSLRAGTDGIGATYHGFDFGRFMAGLDIRISRVVGLGPFVDFTIGKYASRELETPTGTLDHDIEGRAFHYWLTIGPRIVFMP